MCTKDRNVYIKFVRVSNNLFYYARYLLRLWCSRMWHGGMVSRGRWDMRWWWFSLTDILMHSYHTCNTYIRAHTQVRGRYPSCTDTLSLFFFLSIHIHICSYTYICTYTHTYNLHIYTHTWTYISPRLCTLRWGGDTPAAPFTYYLDIAYLGEGEIPRLHPLHIFLNFAHSGEGEIPQLHIDIY